MKRRFLNLISRCGDGIYAVNHLDTSQLFFKSAAAAAAKNVNAQISSIWEIPQVRRLPATSFAFRPFRSNMYHIIKGVDVFAPFGENKILCADGDPCTRSSPPFPALKNMNSLLRTMTSTPRTS
jgi:hypothetical protein